MNESQMSEADLNLVHHYVGLFMSAYLGGHQDRKTIADEQIETFIQLASKTVHKIREWEKQHNR